MDGQNNPPHLTEDAQSYNAKRRMSGAEQRYTHILERSLASSSAGRIVLRGIECMCFHKRYALSGICGYP